MKRLISILIALSLSQVYADRQAEEEHAKINKAYKIAMGHIKSGNYDEAERFLNAIVKARPSHGNAQYYLGQLKVMKEDVRKSLSKRQLEGLTIEKMEFDKVPLTDVIEGFRILIDEANGDDAAAPIMAIRDPDSKISDKEVSLSISKVPAPAALDYILDIAGAQVSYGERTIMIVPR